jgi:DNA-binding NtrC family response regulator
MPNMQLHGRLTLKKMTPETQAKGEQFIQALIDEGHGYESMKAGFLVSMATSALAKSNGVIAEAAKLLQMHRNALSKIVNAFKLKATALGK